MKFFKLKVKQMGINIQRFVPGCNQTNVTLDQYFTIIHPQVKHSLGTTELGTE